MYTNTLRMTGLSGLDTETMIKQLMTAESMRLNTLKKSRQVNVWKQEQYRGVATNLKTFQNSFLSNVGSALNFRTPSNFKNFTSTIKLFGTDTISNAISISAGSSSMTGNHKLEVYDIAKKDVFVSSAPTTDNTIKGSENFDYSKIKAGDSFNVNLDGVTRNISFDEAELSAVNSDSDFIDLLNTKLVSSFGMENSAPKVSASLAGGKLQIDAIRGHTARLSDITRPGASQKATGEVADMVAGGVYNFSLDIGGEISNIYFQIPEDAENITTSMVAKAINDELTAQEIAGVRVVITEGKLEFRNSNSNKEVTVSGSDLTDYLGFGSDTVQLDNSSVISDLGIDLRNTSTSLNLSRSIEDVFGVTGPISFTINGKVVNLDNSDTVAQMMSKINDASLNTGATITYDSINGKFTLASNKEGAANAITIGGTDAGFLTTTLGLTQTQAAQDAAFSFDGIYTTRESNSFEIEGMVIKLTADAVGKDFSIDLSKDNTKTLEMIKSFVEEYNKLVDALHTPYSTSRPKSDKYSYYEPLTDEEKKALAESEVTKMEAKAQEGLLYHDSILSGILTSMRSMLYEAVELENGGKISLYEIGITTTGDRNDGGKIKINETTLLKALEERGDEIADLFTKSSHLTSPSASDKRRTEGISERLNDIINGAIGSKGTIQSKAGMIGTASVSNNEMYRLISEQDKKISDMLTLLAKKEEQYYLMFSKLESAMMEANNQMSSLQGLLGQQTM